MQVYLDNNATTPIDPRVMEAMLPIFTQYFGNPASSSHAWGWQAEEYVNIAREEIALALAVETRSIIFTSCATEAINLAIKGLSHLDPKRIVSSKIDHKATLDCCDFLEKEGFEVEYLEVDSQGLLKLEQLAQALDKPTLLTSIILANNEIGTIQDVDSIKQVCKKKNCLLHLDAVQALGKIPLNLKEVDLASFSAHKLYGPKGVGALYVAPTLLPELRTQIHGGGHEHNLRSGTLNVANIVGFGKAASLAHEESSKISEHINLLSATLLEKLSTNIPRLKLNGHSSQRIPGNLNLSLGGIDASKLISALSTKVALSSGSACMSGDKSGSHVLKALGLPKEEVRSSIRIGVGRLNSLEEIEFAASEIVKAYHRCSIDKAH